MLRLARPWALRGLPEGTPFGPADCLYTDASGPDLESGRVGDHVLLLRPGKDTRALVLHPYPRRGAGRVPDREGFVIRPRRGKEKEASEEARRLLTQMNEVVARVQELGEALDEPTRLWPRLLAAWNRAEREEDPRMAEIVRQARDLGPVVRELRDSLRRVLRRTRETVPLGRVQEMDRTSMRWLSRQPGVTLAERAGAAQRVLAVVRHESFDTLENRVAHAYLRLAADVAREWEREHPRASTSERFQLVARYGRSCRALALELQELGVGVAEPDAIPNFVLLENKTYRQIYQAWLILLREEKTLDDLWVWQAETWADFCILAVALSLYETPGAELVAQAPIRFLDEPSNGRWFEQERPMAVFWLRQQNIIVEVISRLETPGRALAMARAPMSLRISNLSDPSSPPQRVAIWTPHAMQRLPLQEAAEDAAQLISLIARLPGLTERLRHGLILTPAHGQDGVETARNAGALVRAVAMDAAGTSLAHGREALRDLLQQDLWGAA